MWIPGGSEKEAGIVKIEAVWERKQEFIPVVMVREDLTDLPAFPLPEGYSLRYYRTGEDHHWAEIEVSVASFDTMDGALAAFEREFGPGRKRMEERCLYLEDPVGRVIGTSTAWYNPAFNGKDYGRIHWIAIRPEYQGRGLAKPLLAASLQRIADFHDRAYLTTQTTSARAINLYLDFDFIPFETYSRCKDGWAWLASVLDHPSLAAYRD